MLLRGVLLSVKRCCVIVFVKSMPDLESVILKGF